MATLDKQAIEKAIATYIDPYLKTDLISTKSVKTIEITDDNSVNIHVQLDYPAENYRDALAREIRKTLAPLKIENIDITVDWKITQHAVQEGLKGIKGVKNIIAVASGKGGVGKSTTAVNLALALQAEGGQAAILDADIYGPSQPLMLGASDVKPESMEGETITPIMRYGIQSMSIGYLIDQDDTPMIWRGPMVSSALQELLHKTQWDNVDYLIIDLPPGTGDIQLTLSQKIPVSGAVIVTTPQDLALLDVNKCIKMFEKVKVPVLGVIENMSVHICSQCGHQEHIFGTGGAKSVAKKYGVNVLGSLPLDSRIREASDAGKPSVADEPDCAIALCYREIAHKLAAQLSLQTKDYASKFPNIVIENN